ncbi:MAG: cache domain-containing protein [Parashewanella sp.]
MNNKLKESLFVAGLAMSVPVAADVVTKDPAMYVTHIETQEELRAKTLLAKSIKHVEKNGADAVNDFNQKADFFDGNLYTFALTIDGKFLSSGGASSVLVGDTVLDTFDMYGKYFFREMIHKAVQDGEGSVEYHWKNPTDRGASPKRTLFKRVGDIIIAVGYYPVRATAFQAKELLGRATVELQKNIKSALFKFNNLDGQYVNGDLYIFVVDTKTKEYLAHGVSRSFVGQSADVVLDEVGKEAMYRMLNAAKANKEGEIDYVWFNPITGRKERKHTYFKMVDNYLLGVGFYLPL